MTRLLVAIAAGDRRAAVALLDATPSLTTAALVRTDEFFVAERRAQVYEGDTALHAAAFSYDREMALELVTRGADVRARNRRGAEPLHAAVMGEPGTPSWNPSRQREVIAYLIEAGADPDAAAVGGVTPLHRAVRNRCSAAVEALLRAGADPRLENDGGFDRVRSRAADDRARRHRIRRSQGRATDHRRPARREQRVTVIA